MQNQNIRDMKRKGFTLVEIIAVLVILGILASVAVPKYIDLQAEAGNKAIDAAIAELNGRESLLWGKVKLSTNGWSQDSDVTGHTDYSTNVGTDFVWSSGPDASGGSIYQKSMDAADAVALTRTASTSDAPGRWSR